jgi:aspartate aminotransferase
MIRLSDKVNSLPESETIAMARKSRALKAAGLDVINLSLGEPDFFTPNEVKEAAKNAIDQNFSFYTNVSGYEELRDAICKKFLRDNSLTYQRENIVVSTGAKHSIINVLMAVINPNDEVVIPAPYWVSYQSMVSFVGGKSVIAKAGIETDFKLSAAQLESFITPNTKAIIFSSPCNPTGSVYRETELRAWAEMLKKYPDVLIISDEIYEYINFSGNHFSIAQVNGMQERTCIINGLSKGYAMTGWRVGFIAAPAELAKACDKIQGQFTSATSSISQKACEEAMHIAPQQLKYMLEAFRERRDVFYRALQEIKGLKLNLPDGAFYFFPDVSTFFGKSFDGKIIQDSEDLATLLIDKAHVATVTGKAFGAPECIRFSYAISKERLVEAVERMKKIFDKIQ